MTDKKCTCHKTKERSQEEIKKLLNRLNRIEGQVRGLKKMVENNTYCIDILTQASAVNSAINAFNKEILSNHLHSCVINDIQKGKKEIIDELLPVMQKLMK